MDSSFYSQWLPLIIFGVVILYFIIRKWKKIEVQNLIPYVIYFALYKTKIGIKFMRNFSKKHRKLVHWFGYIGIVMGFVIMIYSCVVLSIYFWQLVTQPKTTQVMPSIVLPFKAKGVLYVPFFYWIISLILLMIFHEGSHGIVASSHKIKIKSSGFAILSLGLPILPAAFVEPDEKQLEKKKLSQRLSVYAAGPFMNIILGVIFFAVLLGLMMPVISNASSVPKGQITFNMMSGELGKVNGLKVVGYYEPNGAVSPLKTAGIPINSTIKEINSQKIYNLDSLSATLAKKHPGDNITIMLTNNKTDTATLVKENPEIANSTQPLLGGNFEYNTSPLTYPWSWLINPIYIFIYWFALLNLGIGMFNLMPMGSKRMGLVLDGGFMAEALFTSLFKKRGEIIYKTVSFIFFIIVFTIVISPFIF